jgi:Na+/H+ antiporter NhaD/arsenite permease-like protein
MKGIFKAIEQWASESEERVKLLIILVWAGFGLVVLLSTLITAWIMLPPDFKLF